MGATDEPRLGDIWARTGEVTHRMKFGFGEAGEGNFLPQICPRPRSSFSPRRQFFRSTLDGDIDDRYTFPSCVHYIQGHAGVPTNLDRAEVVRFKGWHGVVTWFLTVAAKKD